MLLKLRGPAVMRCIFCFNCLRFVLTLDRTSWLDDQVCQEAENKCLYRGVEYPLEYATDCKVVGRLLSIFLYVYVIATSQNSRCSVGCLVVQMEDLGIQVLSGKHCVVYLIACHRIGANFFKLIFLNFSS